MYGDTNNSAGGTGKGNYPPVLPVPRGGTPYNAPQLGGMADPTAAATARIGADKSGGGGGSAGASSDPMSKIADEWQAFFDALNKPLDFNDPYIKNILDNARAGTIQGANDQGIFGGYSNAMGEQAYMKGAAGLQQQNKALALQALSGLTGVGEYQQQFAYDKAKDQYTNQMDLWKYQQGQNQNFGSLLGGGLGAIAGGLGGFALGGPAGIADGVSSGWKLGSTIGGGIGGSSGGPPPTFNPGGY